MIIDYIILSLLFIFIDFFYLYNSQKYFNHQINLIQNSNISLNLYSTFLCYLTLTLGIYYFAIFKKISILDSFLLGIFVYGVYEFTNHAIFDNWKWSTVVMDTLWGGVLFALVVYLFRKVSLFYK